MNRKPFTYQGCVISPEPLAKAILVGCNNNVNRYLSLVWRVVFPDQTWCRVGTKLMALRYIAANRHRHQS